MRSRFKDPDPIWIRLASLILVVLAPCLSSSAGEISSFVIPTHPREIVLFVGVTDLEASQTRSVTVYGDGTAVLHVDTEKEVLKEVSQKIDGNELEAEFQKAVAKELPNWDSEGLGRRAEALGSWLIGTSSKTRTRVLLAFEKLTRAGITESQIAPTFAVYDSRALATAFPEIPEYSAVVRLEDWMESLWQRPPPVGMAPTSDPPALLVPSGSTDMVLQVLSRSAQTPRQTQLRFFGDGGVLLETQQAGETIKSQRGQLAPAELAELQSTLRRLANFDPRSISVQIFRKTGQSIFNPSSDVGPQSFEIHLKSPDGEPFFRRIEYASGGAARRFPSIVELVDLKRVWELAYRACGRK